MSEYTVSVKRSAAKALKGVPVRHQQRIVTAINGLREEPRPDGIKTLDSQKKVYRLRVGSYRIIYQVKDRELLVLVVHLGDRREVYRQLNDLLRGLG